MPGNLVVPARAVDLQRVQQVVDVGVSLLTLDSFDSFAHTTEVMSVYLAIELFVEPSIAIIE